ncbi:MAG: GIY-YIG nuclease family protein [Anaerolineales bacterium]
MSAVCWLSAPGSRGAYVLRIAIDRAVRLPVGRFRGGAPLDFSAGVWLYVGSARGPDGLARRLLRHAIRRQGAPHTVLPALVEAFDRMPPVEKRLHWHVDYLLECPQADLEAVYLLAEPDAPLESALVRRLAALPEVSAPFRGLGAGDDPGGTHLLMVDAPPVWWSGFPVYLRGWRQNP